MTDRELMQQALEALEAWNYLENPKPDANVIAALRAAIEQAQEPVAWADEIIDDLHAQYNTDGIKEIDSGDALIRLDEAIAAVEEAEKRHAAPPQRKPLTNGEIYTAYITATNQTLRATDERLAFAFARAIEAAHGIKGEA